MRIIQDYREVPGDARGAVAALGNFDGVHRGHQSVVAKVRALAQQHGAPSAIVTFEPHPRQFFRPADPPFRLTPFPSKARLLAALGIDLLFALPFDADLARLDAEAFAAQVLAGGLGLRHVVVGRDFLFGRGRSGTVAGLASAGSRLGFETTTIEPVPEPGGSKISSSHIRDQLRDGDPVGAAALLGHWWEVEGAVEQGDQRGRLLGFPTANVALGDSLVPKLGVYAVRAGIEAGGTVTWHDAVANIGLRPTFGKDKVALEVHLLGFTGDLYGRPLRVTFNAFVRPEQKFAGLDALKAQIAADSAKATALLAEPSHAAGRFGLPG